MSNYQAQAQPTGSNWELRLVKVTQQRTHSLSHSPIADVLQKQLRLSQELAGDSTG